MPRPERVSKARRRAAAPRRGRVRETLEMFRQLILLIAGLAGGALLMQAPAFVNQYKQNLAGRIDELSRSIVSIERDVAANIGRDASVALLTGRRDALRAHQATLAAAGPALQVIELARNYDREVADSALFEFEPGLPLTLEGAAYGGVGFVIGRSVVWLLLLGLGVFSPRRRAPA